MIRLLPGKHSKRDRQEEITPGISETPLVGTGPLRDANEQLKAEVEERKRAEERLRILFESAPDAYYLNDLRARFVDGNKAAEALVGYERDELIGRSFLKLDILPKSQIPKAVALLARNALGKATGPDEFTLIRKDGTQIPVEIRTFPVTIQDRKLVLGIARDLSQRQQTQAMLMQRNLVLEMLNELSREVSETLEAGPMMDKVAKVACQAISATSAYICAWNEGPNKTLVLGEYISPEASELEGVSDLGEEYAEDELIVELMQEGGSYFIDHIDDPDLPPQDREHMEKYGGKSVLGVALLAREKPIGFIEVWESRFKREFTPEEIEQVRAIGRQVGMSIDNARLHEQLRQHARRLEEQQMELESLNLELMREVDDRLRAEEAEKQQRVLAEALRESAAAVSSTLEKDAVLDRILLSVGKVLPHDAANIMLVDSGFARVARSRGYEKHGDTDWIRDVELDIAGVPGLQQMVESGAPLLVADTRLHPNWVTVQGGEWIRSTASVPIRQAGKTIGFLTLDSATPDTFSSNHAEALKVFAEQVAIAIRNAALYEDTRMRLTELTKLWQIGSAVVSELTSGEILDLIVQSAAELTNADGASICMLSPDGKTRTHIASTGAAENVFQDRSEKSEEGLDGFVLISGKPLLVSNLHQDPRVSKLGREVGATGAIVAPLKIKDQIIGTLSAFSSRPEPHFTKHNLRILSAYADHAAISIYNSRLYQANERHATELEKAAEELATANEHLRTLSKVKDEFVSNVSHELRTPIASLKIYQQLLTKRPGEIETILETLQRETNQLERIIEDLLHLSRLDLGFAESKFDTLKLEGFLSACVQDRIPMAESQELSLKLELEPDLPAVHGDAGLLSQALSTILTNALNYTPSGGQIVVGTASRAQDGKQWAGFYVRDSGPGIHPDDQSQIFNRFFRGEVGRTSKVPGTGLGLAIAKKIVDQHNGLIEVQSSGAAGEGATFFVWLPVPA